MKKTCYVFCHGLGLDRSFWRFLKPYFEKEETFYCDLGYFGEPSFPSEIHPEKFDYVGVGHSLGLIKLLALPIPWRSLIGLHGFINFLGYDSSLRVRRTREWKGLCAQFKRSPILTLQNFYQRVGVEMYPAWEAMNSERLFGDLESLAIPTNSTKSIILLASRKDVIVPPDLLEDNLRVNPNVCMHYVDDAQHNLGYVLPEIVTKWCCNLSLLRIS